jgi:hypothetical protein
MTMIAAVADAVTVQMIMIDVENIPVEVKDVLQEEVVLIMMITMMMIVVMAVEADKADGLEILVDIQKLQKEDGKIVEVAMVAAEEIQVEVPMAEVVEVLTMMTIVEAHVVVVEMAVDGLVIMKDIQKHLNAVGKAAVAVMAEGLTVIHRHVVVAARGMMMMKAVDGLEILKDIQKQQNVAGKTEAVLLQEAVHHETMMMMTEDQAAVVDAVDVAEVADMADGLEIQKVMHAQHPEDGEIAKRRFLLLNKNCPVNRAIFFVIYSYIYEVLLFFLNEKYFSDSAYEYYSIQCIKSIRLRKSFSMDLG